MINSIKPFATLTAADLMTKDPVLIPQEMSLRGAAQLLTRALVTGAPVVDDDGRCVGVISSTDFLRLAQKDAGLLDLSKQRLLCFYSNWQIPAPESLPTEKVSSLMTADPVMVTPCTRIVELSRKMVDAHVHRVVVIDEWSRPIGIVSSIDLLAAIARMPNPTMDTGRTPWLATAGAV
jgi:CBS-domain-containing membrane protein